MPEFKVLLSHSAEKDLNRLDDPPANRILASLEYLQQNPFPRKKLIKKIKGKKSNFYRLRIGKYRVFYSIEASDVVILRVLGKKDADKYIRKLE